nr:hypothetical protein [Desulfobulbaceae bacterium]
MKPVKFKIQHLSPRYRSVIAIAFIYFLLSGCLHHHKRLEPETTAEAKLLQGDLVTALGYQDDEAERLAKTALFTTRTLSQKYRPARFPLFNNFLVHIGLKSRGLCCHWTEELLNSLQDLELKQFSIIWAVSNYGGFREHSSVAVIPANQPFENGLILDPWRNAGILYWGQISKDTYDWQPHPGHNNPTDSIECKADSN